MPLTSGWLLVLLGVAGSAGFLALALGVPRVHGRWLAVATRTGQLVVLNVLVLALAGAALNDQFLWYVNWSDLLGTGSAATAMQAGGSGAGQAGDRPPGVGFGQWAAPATLPALPQPGSRLQTYTITGVRSGLTRQVLVDLPAGYDPRAARSYPVLFALHGFPGHPMTWLHPIYLDRAVDAAVAAGTVAAPIIVMPQIDAPIGLDSECTDAAVGHGPRVETFLAADVPAWVSTHFRVARSRSSWAVAGFSSGGYCAAVVALHHPDVFGAGIVFIGYFLPDFSSAYRPFAPGSVAARPYDLVALAGRPPPPTALWVLSSKTDGLSYSSTADLLKAARAPLTVRAVILQTGGHRLAVFTPYLPTVLSWLGATLPGFRGVG